LELQNVRKSYGAVEVIREVSLSIEEGDFIVLVGPSGCGKSTLLRCIAGLEPISSGRLLQGSRDITASDPVSRGVAMVFQSYALYPHMTVAENIGFGLKIAGEKKATIVARVLEIAELLRLETLLSRKPRALSGGQRQRVAIGRALARRPRLFLFDEPLSNLDASLRAEMRVELAKLHEALGNTMIYVTHDQVEGMTLADKIVVMNDGVIEQAGAPLDLYNNPVNKFVASFLGQPPMNFVRVTPARQDGARLSISMPGGLEVKIAPKLGEELDQEGLEIGLRPEDMTISRSDRGLAMGVEVVEQLGNETIVYGRLADDQSITVRIGGQAKFAPSQRIVVSPAYDRMLVFDRHGKRVASEIVDGE
jgi:ABC-type sugar transport system ATPase subunit